jgi:DNA-binding PadR family transcriptional regulator
MHGYQVIQELEAQTRGRWRPSAGSVYPTLQLLEDEGLVTSEPVDGRRTYSLTDEGRKATTDLPSGRGPWADAEGGDATDLRRLALQIVSASLQVSRIGSPESRRQAAEILVETRRRMYGLLAEDTGSEPTDPAQP